MKITFLFMQERETLAELICRTVLEFEQRQAALLRESPLKNDSVCSNIAAVNQALESSKKKTA
jgi:hypothetical protein